MIGNFNLVLFLTSAIAMGAVFLFGSVGEILTEKSGHLNLGIPGIMCVGASFGCIGASKYMTSLKSYADANWFAVMFISMFMAMLFAALLGGIYSFLTVSLRSNQNVTGLAITTFGVGLSKFLNKYLDDAALSAAGKLVRKGLPFADKLGWFGQIFLSYGFLVYLAIIIAVVTAYMLKRTRVGLRLRAVGENPAAADAVGISVTKYRYVATCVGSAIAGLGGMYVILDKFGGHWEYVVDSMGWLAIALVIFAMWKPDLSILGSILFGGLYIMASLLTGITNQQRELFQILPYVVTIVVLIISSMINVRENQPPAGLGLNYFREER